MNTGLNIGIDVGSTTVKAVVMDTAGTVLWKDYRRHNTRQSRQVRSFLQEITAAFPDHQFRIFTTGSGSRALSPALNALYIQEVNAVTYAVEKFYPQAGSVIELGGQDAKVIIWKEDEQGRKSTLTFMNDKCAGGTGATIDKILGKIGITHEQASAVRAGGKTIHHIAAKCGVFAETDVVGLVKNGIDKEEIVISLCTAIAKQNLEVLVRGNVLRDSVLLLGGPHTYLPVFAEIWREQLSATWALHNWTPAPLPLEELVFVPPDAQYFAALGAVLFGSESESLLARAHDTQPAEERLFEGFEALDHVIGEGRLAQMMASGAVRQGLVSSAAELQEFTARYSIPPFEPPPLKRGSTLRCCIGIDGGSTSSKLALIDHSGTLIYKDYILSQGNPIADVRQMFEALGQWSAEQAVTLDIIGTAVTGYASAILKTAFGFDKAIVETVAHMRAAVATYGEVDLICDVGGQDIKVLFMKHGRVVDFKLNTQCSAGNGYFLQAMAEQFGIAIEDYAARAFTAHQAPAFNYGCAVFMEQDRVNFQQLGWTNEEIMAGLALVLPLNIWNYVVQEPHIARFGTRFVLQGGTQKNLAAVKAQVDYIKSRIPEAQVHVHKYADIGGAIGAALEINSTPADSCSFIGIQRAATLRFTTTNDQTTRCRFCTNSCQRTFVDIAVEGREPVRFISGYGCEKGAVEEISAMRQGQQSRDAQRNRFPNLVELSSKLVFENFAFDPLPAQGSRSTDVCEHNGLANAQLRATPFSRSSTQAATKRSGMVIGMPRLLNMFMYAPFFSTYFRTLGVREIVWSDYTSERLWAEGNKWGAIDPCFPAKVAPAHIWQLLNKKELTTICFPMITHLESAVANTLGNNACVIQMGTPEVTEAVFTRDVDMFASRGMEYWKPLVRLDRPLEAEGLLLEYFAQRLGITAHENAWAVKQGFAAQRAYLEKLREHGRHCINELIEQDRIGIVVLGHPYHHDPGLNHGILDEFQLHGFSVLCIEALPDDEAFLMPLFGDEAHEGGRDIREVWMRNFNRNTNLKVWGSMIAARHPNLAVIDFSSFKCGHDAPTYSYIDSILDASQTPHFLFHDIDQSKPRASIHIRIQTIEYFLRLQEEQLRRKVGGDVAPPCAASTKGELP